MSTSSVRVLFLGDSASAVRSVRQLESSFGSLHRATGILATGLAVGIVGGLAAATKAAISFDRSMRNVNSLAKLNEKQFQALSKQVLGLSKVTAKGPTDLANGLYDIVSSGFKAGKAVHVLEVSAKAATAGLTDTATASKAVVAILNAYHLSADKARQVSDVLFQEVNLGVNTFEELAQNIGDTAPQAAALKVPFDQVAAALATITLHGTSMAEASTQVSRVLTAMVKPTKDLQKEFHHLGFENGQAAVASLGFVGVIQKLSQEAGGNQQTIAKWLGDIRGIRGVINLTGANLKDYTRLVHLMGDATKGVGATQLAFAEQAKSISFQWDKAKASLAAAAIPVGQLLFPALKRGTQAVGDFALSVQQHMPEIRNEFASVSGIVRDLGGALGDVASNRNGQAVIAGLISALVGARALSGAGSLIAGLRSVNPLLAVAVVGIGILGAALFTAATRGDQLKASLDKVVDAIHGVTAAAQGEQQAHLRVGQAQTAQEGSTIALRIAKRNLADAEKQFGKNSLQTASAQNALKQAQDAVKQSALDLRSAKQGVTKAEREHAAAARGAAAAQDRASAAGDKYLNTAYRGIPAVRQLGQSFDQLNTAARANATAVVADHIRDALIKLGASARYADIARDAVIKLTASLGRVPTVKEVRIYVRTITTTIAGRQTSAPPVKRAGGGFIPMMPGAVAGSDSVHALLAPGEVVLNPAQQNVLGGPGFLADLFGFTGREGPRFAGGGIAGSPPLNRGRKRAPHHTPRGRAYLRTSKAARVALNAVVAVNQRETDLDRAYGQLTRQFDISQEQIVVTDASGVDHIDGRAVARRVREIDRLLASRNEMLALIDQEKRRLQVAIEDLKKAINALVAAIRAESKAAREDAAHIKELEQQIGTAARAETAAGKEITKEQRRNIPAGKKGASARHDRDVHIHALQDQQARQRALQSKLRAQVSAVKRSESGHVDKARGLGNTLGDFRTALTGAVHSRDHEIAFDRKDVQLDILDLKEQGRQLLGTTVTPSSQALGGGLVGGDTGGSPLLGDSSALQDQVAELIRQLGQTRLALGIQNAQLPILASFQKGTIHVPQTGAYLLHAGEGVTPGGVNRGNQGPFGGGDVHVHIHADEKGFAEYLQAHVVMATPLMMREQGRLADRRRREGRY